MYRGEIRNLNTFDRGQQKNPDVEIDDDEKAIFVWADDAIIRGGDPPIS